MKHKHGGFTLIELVVVVMIMGILASLSIPYYYKTIETSKATDAVALGNLLANANRMYRIDNPGTGISGPVNNACNSNTLTCASATGACKLVACQYIAKQDWSQSAYNYYVCNGSSGGGYCASGAVASVKRAPGASSDYSGWGYMFGDDGSCNAQGSTPPCPKI